MNDPRLNATESNNDLSAPSARSRPTTNGVGYLLKSSIGFILKSTIPIVLGIAIWQWASTQLFSSILFPTPRETFVSAIEMVRSGSIFRDSSVSMLRIFQGFLIGSIFGIFIGLLVGTFKVAAILIGPFLQFFRFIPPIAWISPAIIWFGIGEASKLFIIIYGTVFIVALNTVVGVQSVHPDKIRAARMFGATKLQMFQLVIAPSAVYYSVVGMRLAMGIAFMTVVSAEMLGSEQGLGYMIMNGRLWMATDRIFVGIIVLGILGLTIDRLFSLSMDKLARRYK